MIKENKINSAENRVLINILRPFFAELFNKGFSKNYFTSCVRFGDIQPLTGGLKTKTINHIQLTIDSVIKIDNDELVLHKYLMEIVNNKFDRTFPEILQLKTKDEKKYILIMEKMRAFSPFLNLIYQKDLTKKELEYLSNKAMEFIARVHKLDLINVKKLKINQNPYNRRIKSKIKEILKNDPALQGIKTKSGKVNGIRIKSLNTLLNSLSSWLRKDLKNVKLVLVHGDSHIGNILFRRRGTGYSCSLIDPNPLIGISDPIYDYGKLLHWIDIVGWAKINPKNCGVTYLNNKKNWTLQWKINELKSVKKRREIVWTNIYKNLELNKDELQGDWKKRLNISLAAAHLGLAALLKEKEQIRARRFVFARALELLAECEL